MLIYIVKRIIAKEKRRDEGEHFLKAAWNTSTIFVLFLKINSLWKIMSELMIVPVKKPVYSS